MEMIITNTNNVEHTFIIDTTTTQTPMPIMWQLGELGGCVRQQKHPVPTIRVCDIRASVHVCCIEREDGMFALFIFICFKFIVGTLLGGVAQQLRITCNTDRAMISDNASRQTLLIQNIDGCRSVLFEQVCD
jgi:hypothetical protein